MLRVMRRPRQMLAKEPVAWAAFLCMAAAAPGCSAASPPGGPAPAAVPSASTTFAFTVVGTRPVLPTGSQDTHAQTPKAGCDRATFAADKAMGSQVGDAF